MMGSGQSCSDLPATAVVLSGGGALGAFEAGVLSYVLGDLGREAGARFTIFAGTSVGALNACSLAAGGDDQRRAAASLVSYWESVTLDKVLDFGFTEAGSLLKLMMGRSPIDLFQEKPRPGASPHDPVAGLFDTGPLRRHMKLTIPWERIGRNVDESVIRGIALCATEVCTGKSVVFYDSCERTEFQHGTDPFKEIKKVRLGLDHAMASAAIPFLFPAEQIDGVCYADGGLRQNTPLNPALRLGADRLLVISLTPHPAVGSSIARAGCRRNPYPGALFLLGRMVNVFLNQSLDYELNRVEMYNRLISGGRKLYGDEFLSGLNRIMGGYRNATYRPIVTCHVRPDEDLRLLAVQALRDDPLQMQLAGLHGKLMGRLLGSTAFSESELLSYIMFTPGYIATLLELGYNHARASRDDLMRLFDP